ncbi:hypothetical protein ID852_04845 [Xenorhabdus sp. 42]|uniref:hypothetical protein n=1 Tax=Xenorhabdus szentirmaii TaxID=290112 RepID=UPI0019C7136B|nr:MULTISPECIES: hypothetical protein [unclassified Xenorhabdus]MBD2791905.1 hypothetical protein [Xenorhabdus sp. CUL]MBD2820031.1 hypothetical protein [Xenorhabdus sp. 42]
MLMLCQRRHSLHFDLILANPFLRRLISTPSEQATLTTHADREQPVEQLSA